MIVEEAVILAGGLGTRLRAVVNDVPKPMAQVNDRPFLSYLFDYLVDYGVKKVILSVGYKGDVIRTFFGDRYSGLEVVYSEEKTQLGTGGGMLQAIDQVEGEHFLCLNGDSFFGVDLKMLARRGGESDAGVTLALKPGAAGVRYGGVLLDDCGRVVAFGEKQAAPGSFINGGVYVIKSSIARRCRSEFPGPASIEHDLIPWLLERGEVMVGFVSDSPFIDIGVPDDYGRAGEFFRGLQ